jgi:hypothetical protein
MLRRRCTRYRSPGTCAEREKIVPSGVQSVVVDGMMARVQQR